MDADSELWAAMGMPMSFGKQKAKKTSNVNFDKTKRAIETDEAASSMPHEPTGEIGNTGDASISGSNSNVPSSSKGKTTIRGPQRPPPGPEAGNIQTSDGDDDSNPNNKGGDPDMDVDSDFEDEVDTDSEELFPTSHEMVFKDHAKVISALALDPSGARILSGSHDYDCKLWDFGGMSGGASGSDAKPFRTWEPAGSYHVHDVKYSPFGDQFLVISGTSQPKLYDREGEEKATYIKGDPYIRDMKNTAGHVGELTSCAWHPKDGNTFITASMDSTIRIWDVEDRRKQKTVIVVKSKERGTRTKVTACSYSHDGSMIAGACLDGTINFWGTNSNFVRPSQTAENAHVKGTETGSIIFSVDGKTLLTRGNDDFVKLWDIRAFKKPLYTSPQIPTLYPEANAILSPDEKYVVVGKAAVKTSESAGKGSLLFLRREGLDIEKEVEFDSGESCVKVVWHSKINQILCGTSTGAIRLFYSPHMSSNGAKLLLGKTRRKMNIEDYAAGLIQAPIITPHALPMFRDEGERGTKRKRDKDRMDPRKTKRPMPPVSGPGKGGRVGASATQHLVQSLVRDSTRDEDPREALLKYAEQSEKDPLWTSAWKANQPKPVFQDVDGEEEEEEEG